MKKLTTNDRDYESVLMRNVEKKKSSMEFATVSYIKEAMRTVAEFHTLKGTKQVEVI